MAKLFSKEYHDLSNTWYFKTRLLPLYEGELKYQAVENEEGNLLLRFFAVPEKKKYLPDDLLIVYDREKEEIIDHKCGSCPVNESCNHILTVINYAYHHLTTDIDKSESDGSPSARALTVDSRLSVYSNRLLAYNAYWQLIMLNGKILVEGVYDRSMDKIRFYFSGYTGVDLRLIALHILKKDHPGRSSGRRKQAVDVLGQDKTADLKLLEEQAAAFSDSELALLYLLQNKKCSYSHKHSYFTIYKRDFIKTFPYLQDIQSKVLIKETGEQMQFSAERYPLSLQVTKAGDSHYRIKVGAGSFHSVFYPGNESYIFVENIIYKVHLPFKKEIISQILQEGYTFPERDLAYFASVVARQTGLNNYYLDFAEGIDLPRNYTSSPGVKLQISKENGKVILQGSLIYEQDISTSAVSPGKEEEKPGKEIPVKSILFATELICYKSPEGVEEWFYLPFEKREDILRFLRLLPLPDEDLLTEKSQYIYTSEDKKDRLKKTLYEKMPADWLCELDEALKKEFIYSVELKPVVNIKDTGTINWFDYQVVYQYHDISFTHEELKRFFRTKEKYLKLPDNRLVYFSGKEKFTQLDRFFTAARKQHRGESHLSNYNLSYLYVLAKVNKDIKIRGETYLEKMYSDLVRRRGDEHVEVPRALFNVMRSYQKTGFYWMKMLQKYHLGGLLADDMGLGKTLQALAILSDYYEQLRTKREFSLVICPKTLLFNWAIEIEKFHPNLTYTIYEGSKLQRLPLLENNKSDIIIVSYSLVQMDIDHFIQYSYAYIILDEAQHIKNPLTLRSKAVKKLRAEYRLALTGTPMENNLVDLWSIFDFLMPGYLQTLREFRKEYTDEEEEGREEKKKRLSRIVSPFILRRRKSEVLFELPDKQEQYLYNRMTPQQEKLYLKILAMAKEKLILAAEKDSKTDYINILTALVRLRQTCNHPGLVDPDLLKKSHVSGKMELLMELIQDAVENGRKILVFSQFAMMLKLIAKNLDMKELIYEYMDGKTSDRKERVEHFSSNEKVRVFLLTLKVGGLGLNLTAADTVIMVDPWWNPMSENQSIDRVYRIGQTKKVLVYKIITKGTVEEKILQLQKRKRDVFSNVIEGSQSLISKMSLEDIRELFEYHQ